MPDKKVSVAYSWKISHEDAGKVYYYLEDTNNNARIYWIAVWPTQKVHGWISSNAKGSRKDGSNYVDIAGLKFMGLCSTRPDNVPWVIAYGPESSDGILKGKSENATIYPPAGN